MSAAKRAAALASAALVAAVLGAGCGSDGGETSVAAAPSAADAKAPASGTLRVFAYGDTLTEEMLEPFREQNPDVDLQTASFNSNKAAAAKLAGGFEADVVEVCADEMSPLVLRGLLRPIDPAGVAEFDRLAFSDSDEIRDAEGGVLFMPASAGPHGLIVNTEEVAGADSYADLFDPAYTDRAAIESTPLTGIGVAALALGLDDPMNLSLPEVEQVKEHLIEHRDQFRDFPESDASTANLFKSGEAVIADGGRGTTAAIAKDGVPVEWVAPEEGALSWVCGLGITSSVENVEAAYKFLNYYASPEAQAISGEQGFVAMNPAALKLMPKEDRETADPASLESAIPETQPDEEAAYDRAWQEVVSG